MRSFRFPVAPEVEERVGRLEIPFSANGVDPYGIDRHELARFFTVLGWCYRNYFRVDVFGTGNVPLRGRAMLVGNHSGGIALDGAMVLASMFFDKEPPRLAQGMAEKFLARLPFSSIVSSRIGQFAGLPEHAVRLLEDERLLMVFPEGTRGTAKLYAERDSLVRFGTGFIRLALQTKTPIVPFAFVGGGDAVPTFVNLYKLGQSLGLPYIPVTPWVAPLPLPTKLQLLYGAPLDFEGTGAEEDELIEERVEQVKSRIARLLKQGRDLRQGRISDAELELGRSDPTPSGSRVGGFAEGEPL